MGRSCRWTGYRRGSALARGPDFGEVVSSPAARSAGWPIAFFAGDGARGALAFRDPVLCFFEFVDEARVLVSALYVVGYAQQE
jgi:hypothetical protein